MNEFIQILRVVSLLLPIIRELVASLEGIEGDGPTKLRVVLDALRTAYESTMSAGIDWAKLEPIVRSVIENVLTLIRSKK